MSVFIGAFAASGIVPSFDLDVLADYCPLEPARAVRWDSSNDRSRAAWFGWEGNNEPEVGSDRFGVYLGRSRSTNPSSDIWNRERLSTDVGGFVAIGLSDDELRVHRSLSGEISIFHCTIDDVTYVATRIPLLLAVMPSSPPLNPVAVAELAGSGYTYGTATAFTGVELLAPGAWMHQSAGSPPRIDLPDLSALCAPIRDDDLLGLMESVSQQQVDYLSTVEGPLTLGLSGGKDSRAFAALLSAADRLGSDTLVQTFGEPYSPEIPAAQQVVETLGAENHVVSRRAPSGIDPTTAVIDTINSTQGSLSLFDRASVGHPTAMSTSVEGLESVVKGGYFRDLSQGSADEVIAEIQRRRPVDQLGLLTPSGLEIATKHGADTLMDMHSRGLSADKLGHAFMWAIRSNAFCSTMSSKNNIAGKNINLFLDADLVRLAMGMPASYSFAHLIPFMWMTKSRKPITLIPFAGDTWPEELPDVLRRAHWTGEMPMQVPALSWGEHHPRIDDTQRIVTEYAGKCIREFYLPYDTFDDVLDRSAVRPRIVNMAGVARMISLMGVATSGLLNEFGRDIFRRSQRTAIQQQLARVAALPVVKPATPPPAAPPKRSLTQRLRSRLS